MADVLYFNFGLHNLNNSTLPGQAGPVAEYAPYLEKIVAKLALRSSLHVVKMTLYMASRSS